MVIKVKDGKDIELIEYIVWLTKDISKKILLKKKFLVKNSDRCIYVSISRNKRFKNFWQHNFLQNTDICNFAIFKMIFIYIFNEDKDFSFIIEVKSQNFTKLMSVKNLFLRHIDLIGRSTWYLKNWRPLSIWLCLLRYDPVSVSSGLPRTKKLAAYARKDM